MPDTPAMAKFLTDEEKIWALRRMRLDASGSTAIDVDEEKLDWRWVRMALRAPQMWFCAAIWFFLLVPLYVSPVYDSFIISAQPPTPLSFPRREVIVPRVYTQAHSSQLPQPPT